jgi:hypothetical protein
VARPGTAVFIYDHASANHLGKREDPIFAHHRDVSGLIRLLDRYGEPLLSMRTVDHDGQQSFKQSFALPPRAAWTIFASWRLFLIAGNL